MALFERKRKFSNGYIYLYDGIWPTLELAENRIAELRSKGYEAKMVQEKLEITKEDATEGRTRLVFVIWKRKG